MTVDRTCPYCQTDKGILKQIHFYDYDAMKGTTEHKFPVVSGGLLNICLCCGDEVCFKNAMRLRKVELVHAA